MTKANLAAWPSVAVFLLVVTCAQVALQAQAPPPPLPPNIPAGATVIIEQSVGGPPDAVFQNGVPDGAIIRRGPNGQTPAGGPGGRRGNAEGGNTATGPAGPGGKVSGTILDSLTGQPLRKVTVRLSRRAMPVGGLGITMGGPGNAGGLAATTGDDGKFAFDAVPAGNYFVSAEKSGYIRGNYGARSPRGMGSPITVQDEGVLAAVDVKLLPQSAISGRVLDADGDPIQNAMVQVAMQSYQGGKKRLQVVGMGQSNDRGEFRVANLPPGKYFVSVEAPFLPPTIEGEGESKDRTSFTRTYFPGVTEESAAAPIDIQAGNEVANINVTQRKVPVYRVSGVVRGLTGTSDAGRVNVSLQPADGGNGFRRIVMGDNSNIAADGTFTLKNVVPGNYVANVVRFAGRPRTLGSTRVTVSRQDVEGVSITIAPGGNLQGKVRVEGDQAAKLDGSRVNLSGAAMMGMAEGRVGADGAFTITEVSAESAYLRYAPPQGFYVKDIRFGGQSYLKQPLPLESGTAGPLEIVLTPKPASIRGTVTIDAQKIKGSVRLMLLDENRNVYDPMTSHSTGMMTQASAGNNGEFQFVGLPPGTYHVVAVETEELMQVNIVGVVQQMAAKVKRVELREGETPSVTLDPVTAAELEQVPQ